MVSEKAVLTSKALRDLNLSQEEYSTYGAEVRSTYEAAVKYGNIPCAYRKMMFLGDSGVGKTSTRKLLMGIPHSDRDGQSTFGIEQYFVDDRFQEITPDGHTELERSAVSFAVFGKSNLLSHIKTPIYVTIFNGLMLMFTFFITALVAFMLFCHHGIEFGFTPLLLVSVVPVAVAIGDDIEGFIQGSGLAVVLVIINFIRTRQIPEFIAVIDNSPDICYVMSQVLLSSTLFVAMSMALGLGGRVGMVIAFSMLLPPAYQKILTQLKSVDSYSLTSVMDDSLFLSLAKLLLTFISFAFGIMIHSKFTSQKRRSVICASVMVTCLTVLSVAVQYHIGSEFILAPSLGVVYGYMFIRGLREGHRLRKFIKGSRLLASVFGWEIGIVAAHFMGWNFSLGVMSEDMFYLVLSGIGCVTALGSEIRRYIYIETNPVPSKLFFKIKSSNRGKSYNHRLCLQDCSGNELYHVGHHIFMAKFSIYIIVFSLEDAYRDPTWQINRLLYWINSVFSHSQHRDSLVFLVGSHKSSLSDQQIKDVGRQLRESFFRKYGGRLALNKDRNNCPLFALENRFRKENGTDLETLKAMIIRKTAEAEYAKRPIPVKWSRFHDFLKSNRNNSNNCIIDYYDLWQKMKTEIGFVEETEFLRMLEFFNDYGEIFFKQNDRNLYRHIVINPRMLIDCVESLSGNYLISVPKSLQSDWYSLCHSGTTSLDLLRYLMKDIAAGDVNLNLALLKSMDLIVPLTASPNNNSSTHKFIVPYRLPISNRQNRYVSNNKHVFVLDFGYFYPESLFLKLLTYCYRKVDSESSEPYTSKLFKDFCSFHISGCLCEIELSRFGIGQNLIKIGITSQSTESVYLLLRWLDATVNLLREKDFPYLYYSCGIPCHCNKNRVNDVYHVQPLATHGEHNETQMPDDGVATFICSGIVTRHVIPSVTDGLSTFAIKVKTIADLEFPDVQPLVKYETIVSHSEEDSAWVQCELMLILESAETPLIADFLYTKPTVATRLTNETNPDPSLGPKSPSSIDFQRQIETRRCKSIIVILSRNYTQNANCMRELRMAIANNIYVIPVIIDGCAAPPLLETVRCLDYQRMLKEDNLMMGFYIPLINAVKTFR